MVPAPEYLIEISVKVLSSKAMIDPVKGALDLRIDGFHRIDMRPEAGTGILSGTVIDAMMCSKCFAYFAISPIAISHQNRLWVHPFCHDRAERCALGIRNQGRIGLTVAVSGNKHDRFLGATPSLVFNPFLELGASSGAPPTKASSTSTVPLNGLAIPSLSSISSRIALAFLW